MPQLYKHVHLLTLSVDDSGEVWVNFSDNSGKPSTTSAEIANDENPFEALSRTLPDTEDNRKLIEKLKDPTETFSFTQFNGDEAEVYFFILDSAVIQPTPRSFGGQEPRKVAKEIDSAPLRSLGFEGQAIDESNIKIKLEDIKQQISKPHTDSSQLAQALHTTLHKAMPGLEYRLFNKPIDLPLEPDKEFFGKTLSMDRYFVDEFFEELPIKGLDDLDADTKLPRHSKRINSPMPFTARGSSPLDKEFRKQHGVGKQYTEQQKQQYTKAQSFSLFNTEIGNEPFGFGQYRESKSLPGIADFDVLINRLFIYDTGTINRLFDADSGDDIKKYITKKVHTNADAFDVADFNLFKEKIKNLEKNKYNEILGRIRWNMETSKIMVYEDNQESIWAAIHLANELKKTIKQRADKLLANNKITKEQYQQFINYEPDIGYYFADKNIRGVYTAEQLKPHRDKIQQIFDDIISEDPARIKDEHKEFLNNPTNPLIYDLILQYHTVHSKAFDFKNYNIELKLKANIKTLELYENRVLLDLPDINQKNKDGNTTLIIAIDADKTQLIRKLIANGADIEAKDNYGWTALMFAAEKGHTDIVKLLLENGADIEAKNNSGWSALMAAAGKDHTDIVKLLLENGVNIEAKMDNGGTALMIAAQNDHTDTVKLLLENGANIEAKMDNGWAALMLAARYGHTETVKLLLENGVNIEAKKDNGWTALMFAAEYGHTETVKLLLENGADIEAKLDNGGNALMIAAEKRHMDTIKLLLDRGADIEAKMDNGGNALMAAAQNSHSDTVKLLLDRGADIEAKMDNGINALMIAARNGHSDTVKLLLDRGADIEAKMDNGINALMIAVHKGHTDTVKLLLDRGADIEAKMDNGINALMIAAKNNDIYLTKFLLEKGANISSLDNNAYSAFKHAPDNSEVKEILLQAIRNKQTTRKNVIYNDKTNKGKTKRPSRIQAMYDTPERTRPKKS